MDFGSASTKKEGYEIEVDESIDPSRTELNTFCPTCAQMCKVFLGFGEPWRSLLPSCALVRSIIETEGWPFEDLKLDFYKR